VVEHVTRQGFRERGMSGPQLGFVLRLHMRGCSVFSGDLKDHPNTPINAQETGHFSNNKTPTAVYSWA
jgi:hypothetical protein